MGIEVVWISIGSGLVPLVWDGLGFMEVVAFSEDAQ